MHIYFRLYIHLANNEKVMPSSHVSELREKHLVSEDKRYNSIDLRIHRALSWLDRSEKFEEDLDTRFLYLWIAFNAAYANDVDHHNITERKTFTRFINRLCTFDNAHILYHLVWEKYPQNIRLLLNNKFVFQPFWDFHNQQKTELQFQAAFAAEKNRVVKALADTSQTDVVLSILLSRMYTLRNQFVHGGCTWNSRVNRDQVKDLVAFLEEFVPAIINILLDNRGEIWGDACYPIVDE